MSEELEDLLNFGNNAINSFNTYEATNAKIISDEKIFNRNIEHQSHIANEKLDTTEELKQLNEIIKQNNVSIQTSFNGFDNWQFVYEDYSNLDDLYKSDAGKKYLKDQGLEYGSDLKLKALAHEDYTTALQNKKNLVVEQEKYLKDIATANKAIKDLRPMWLQVGEDEGTALVKDMDDLMFYIKDRPELFQKGYGIQTQRIDKNGNLEFENDGTTINPNFDGNDVETETNEIGETVNVLKPIYDADNNTIPTSPSFLSVEDNPKTPNIDESEVDVTQLNPLAYAFMREKTREGNYGFFDPKDEIRQKDLHTAYVEKQDKLKYDKILFKGVQQIRSVEDGFKDSSLYIDAIGGKSDKILAGGAGMFIHENADANRITKNVIGDRIINSLVYGEVGGANSQIATLIKDYKDATQPLRKEAIISEIRDILIARPGQPHITSDWVPPFRAGSGMINSNYDKKAGYDRPFGSKKTNYKRANHLFEMLNFWNEADNMYPEHQKDYESYLSSNLY